MASGQYAIGNADKVDLNILSAYIYQNGSKAELAGVQKHLQITLAGESGLHREALMVCKKLLRSD